ncbi:molybdopterin dinucleotide binding domain-containing protein, partial [Nocardia farcinica]
LFHFHTRTKTGRVPQLRAAAPAPWVEIAAADAAELGITEGDLLELASARSTIRARARVSRIRPGVLFVPFHYGYWDVEHPGHDRAANEITVTDWDPVS